MLEPPLNDGIAAEVHLLGCRHPDLPSGIEINGQKSGIDPGAQDELRNPPPGG
jgi:hypothetical protein